MKDLKTDVEKDNLVMWIQEQLRKKGFGRDKSACTDEESED
jgi:hypothetical protein